MLQPDTYQQTFRIYESIGWYYSGDGQGYFNYYWIYSLNDPICRLKNCPSKNEIIIDLFHDLFISEFAEYYNGGKINQFQAKTKVLRKCLPYYDKDYRKDDNKTKFIGKSSISKFCSDAKIFLKSNTRHIFNCVFDPISLDSGNLELEFKKIENNISFIYDFIRTTNDYIYHCIHLFFPPNFSKCLIEMIIYYQ